MAIISQTQLAREARTRIRVATLLANQKREEFASLAGAILERTVRLPEPKEIHEKLRWLNLLGLEQQLKLTPREIALLLLTVHRRSVSRGGNLGVPAAILLGPSSLSACLALASETYPGSIERWANEQRVLHCSPLEEEPLPEVVSHILPEYRRRLRVLGASSSLLKNRYRRPFRDNFWQL